MEKNEINLKQNMQLDKVVTYLQNLAAGMSKGEIYIQQGDDYLALKPDANVFVEIKSKTKKDKEKFSLSLSWYKEEIETHDNEIIITSEKPNIPEEPVETESDNDELDDEIDEKELEDTNENGTQEL